MLLSDSTALLQQQCCNAHILASHSYTQQEEPKADVATTSSLSSPEKQPLTQPLTWTAGSELPPVEHLRYPRLMQQLIEATFDCVRRSPRDDVSTL
jgi:hypothetical protein